MHGTHPRPKRVGALAVVLAIVLGVSFAAPSIASGPSVRIRGTTFSTYHFFPKRLEVVSGTTVHWRWASNAPHNVTFPKTGDHSATGTDGFYKLTFNQPGTYRYLCTVHGFKGVIIVN